MGKETDQFTQTAVTDADLSGLPEELKEKSVLSEEEASQAEELLKPFVENDDYYDYFILDERALKRQQEKAEIEDRYNFGEATHLAEEILDLFDLDFIEEDKTAVSNDPVLVINENLVEDLSVSKSQEMIEEPTEEPVREEIVFDEEEIRSDIDAILSVKEMYGSTSVLMQDFDFSIIDRKVPENEELSEEIFEAVEEVEEILPKIEIPVRKEPVFDPEEIREDIEKIASEKEVISADTFLYQDVDFVQLEEDSRIDSEELLTEIDDFYSLMPSAGEESAKEPVEVPETVQEETVEAQEAEETEIREETEVIGEEPVLEEVTVAVTEPETIESDAVEETVSEEIETVQEEPQKAEEIVQEEVSCETEAPVEEDQNVLETLPEEEIIAEEEMTVKEEPAVTETEVQNVATKETATEEPAAAEEIVTQQTDAIEEIPTQQTEDEEEVTASISEAISKAAEPKTEKKKDPFRFVLPALVVGILVVSALIVFFLLKPFMFDEEMNLYYKLAKSVKEEADLSIVVDDMRFYAQREVVVDYHDATDGDYIKSAYIVLDPDNKIQTIETGYGIDSIVIASDDVRSVEKDKLSKVNDKLN